MGTQKNKPTLSNRIIYGYSMGEFGYNFFVTLLAYYLMVFLTNVAHLPIALAATVYSITLWIKWLTMPVAGTIIDSSNLKSGKYRGWSLIGSIVMFIGGTLLFTNLHLGATAYAIIYILIFLVTYMGYSLMWVSYRALMDPMSKNPQDKIALSTSAAQMGALARIIYAFGASALMSAFANQDTGYTVTALIFGALIVVGMFVVYKLTARYDTTTTYASTDWKQKKEKLTAKEVWENLKSRPMIIFIISIVFRVSVISIVPTLLVYYINYVLKDPKCIAIYMAITYAVQFLGAMVVRVVANKFGKKPTFIVTTLLSAVFLILVKFIGRTTVPFIVLMSLFQFAGIFAASLVPAFMADIAEYGKLTSGSKAKGFAFSIGGVAVQVGGVLGGMVASFGLVMIKFNTAVTPTQSVLNGLTNLMSFSSAGVSIISGLLFFLYPLTDKYMADLRQKKALEASEVKVLSV